jgi:hypothetical protein
VTWALILLACWVSFLVGFLTCALFSINRLVDDEE